MKTKKLVCLLSALAAITVNNVPVFAAEENNPNIVISTHEDVKVPENVSIEGVSARVSVTYDPDSGIVWDHGYRYVWGSCQAKQGQIKLDSYSRARFEKLLYNYCDSGRVWSKNQGRSYAESGKELYDSLNSGVAHTYYGIGVS